MVSEKDNDNRKKVAVFFGGRSPEHDVSIVTGLQVLNAIDIEKFDPFPVYISRIGEWFTGDILRERSTYIPSKQTLSKATQVTLDVVACARPALMPVKSGLMKFLSKPIEFDIALPAFHGLYGEDGQIQGLFEMSGIPYCGPRTMTASVFMDKETTKHVCRSLGIPVLPCTILRRPESGYYIDPEVIAEMTGDLPYPCIVKPSHLGSSIGVAKVNNAEELSAALPAIFEFDSSAIVEPCVPNLVEYNVAVSRAFDGEIRTSAIEKPKTDDELLDFKKKYMSGSGSTKGSGSKNAGDMSEGMLSLTREINPKIEKPLEEKLRDWSVSIFSALDGSGAPRIDYLCNSRTGEAWLNEVNSLPGSFGYFLWEASDNPVLFTELLTCLIDEAVERSKSHNLPSDPVPAEARLFER